MHSQALAILEQQWDALQLVPVGRAVKIDIKYTGKISNKIKWGGVCVGVGWGVFCKGMPQNPRHTIRFHSHCKIWLQESRFVIERQCPDLMAEHFSSTIK